MSEIYESPTSLGFSDYCQICGSTQPTNHTKACWESRGCCGECHRELPYHGRNCSESFSSVVTFNELLDEDKRIKWTHFYSLVKHQLKISDDLVGLNSDKMEPLYQLYNKEYFMQGLTCPDQAILTFRLSNRRNKSAGICECQGWVIFKLEWHYVKLKIYLSIRPFIE